MRRTSGLTIGLALLAGVAVSLLWSTGDAQAPAAGPAYATVDLERALDSYQQSKEIGRASCRERV